jgi:hypothetical protein
MPDRGDLHDQMDQWRKESRQDRRAGSKDGNALVGDGAGHKQDLTQLAEEVTAVSMVMRERGLPPGQP